MTPEERSMLDSMKASDINVKHLIAWMAMMERKHSELKESIVKSLLPIFNNMRFTSGNYVHRDLVSQNVSIQEQDFVHYLGEVLEVAMSADGEYWNQMLPLIWKNYDENERDALSRLVKQMDIRRCVADELMKEDKKPD